MREVSAVTRTFSSFHARRLGAGLGLGVGREVGRRSRSSQVLSFPLPVQSSSSLGRRPSSSLPLSLSHFSILVWWLVANFSLAVGTDNQWLSGAGSPVGFDRESREEVKARQGRQAGRRKTTLLLLPTNRFATPTLFTSPTLNQ